MGKVFLRNVEFQIDVREGRDYRRAFDFEGNSLQDLKDQINNFGNEISKEFNVGVENIQVKGAGFSQNRFVVF